MTAHWTRKGDLVHKSCKAESSLMSEFQPFFEVQVSVYLPDLKSVVGSRLDE
jgi:hypothetical protein